jgi:mRNA interferase HicA
MPTVETNRAKILKRLEAEGWVIARNGANHDVLRHGSKPGVIVLPRHRTLTPGVARSIAKAAGWI